MSSCLKWKMARWERLAFDRIKKAHIIGQIDFGGRNFDDEDAPLDQDN